MDKKLRHLTNTKASCPKCGKTNGSIWCGYENSRTYFYCEACENAWDYGPEQCSIRTLRITDNGHNMSVFHGGWLPEEMLAIESTFRKIILGCRHAFNDEWAFFKGRQLYTAWRMSAISGRVVMARTLLHLIEQVVVQCRRNQGL